MPPRSKIHTRGRRPTKPELVVNSVHLVGYRHLRFCIATFLSWIVTAAYIDNVLNHLLLQKARFGILKYRLKFLAGRIVVEIQYNPTIQSTEFPCVNPQFCKNLRNLSLFAVEVSPVGQQRIGPGCAKSMPTLTMTSSTSTPGWATPTTSAPSSRPGTPVLSTPSSLAASDKPQDDSSKLRIFLGLLKKFIGVADIAAVRFSLPAQLMEPIPNLEYWHYLDRPETFVSIGKSDDDLGRMLEVLRFWFTKDLKYVKGKPCKPYNSTLGEFFRCNWEILDDAPSIAKPGSSVSLQPPADPLATPTEGEAAPVRISYLTEQTSHHPPVSAYWVECPERDIVARGYDQISAKFTGTMVRVKPGQYNAGIFIRLKKRDEEYQLTHPTANLAGLLKGALYVAVTDTCYITCPKTKIKAILTYLEEGWFGKSKNQVQGVVFRYDPKNDKYMKIIDVPEKEIIAKIDGCWMEQIYYTMTAPGKNGEAGKEKRLLIDLTPLMPVPKIVPPPEQQLPNESRELWKDVSSAINDKRYNDATVKKQDIEQKQRDKAAEREKNKTEWKPRFFTKITDPSGIPELSTEGREAVDGMLKKDFDLKSTEPASA